MQKQEFARLIGVSPPRITQFIKSGLPVLADGTIARDLALKWVAASTVGPAQERARELLTTPETPPGFGVLDSIPNVADKALVFGLLSLSTRIKSLASVAAFEAGATDDVAHKAGSLCLCLYINAAESLLSEAGIEPAGGMQWPHPDLHDVADLAALATDKKKNIKKIIGSLKK